MMSDDLKGGWDAAVQLLVDDGMALPAARDLVIGHFLHHGDLRPFADWVLRGHPPSVAVLRAVAMASLDSLPTDLSVKLPYQLVSKRRDGVAGRNVDPETKVRNALLGANVARLVAGGEKYEAAIAITAERAGSGVAQKTIASAYAKRKRRPGK